MSKTVHDLVSERNKLQMRLNWLGVKSTGSERLEKRIKQLNTVLSLHNERGGEARNKPP